MAYLLTVSLIWAFSFGLIKGNLTGLDPNFVSLCRMALAFLVFLPFLRFKNLPRSLTLKLMLIGMVQYGLMYCSYIYSFQFLKAYQVALFTIFTPLYVTLIHDLFKRRLNRFFLLTVALAIAGTAVIVYRQVSWTDFQAGFALMQISNISFAFGQVYYRHLLKNHKNIKDVRIFALLFFGAILFTGFFAGITTQWASLYVTPRQMWTLLNLGILASGICFFLWNFGARKVDAGALAILNNLKIPLAVACSAIFFHETVNLPRLLVGGGIIVAALWLNERMLKKWLQPDTLKDDGW
ncbi:MAG: EamA family transporter [Deltaproteobacteria bacterium]|nr:EamA family transporter [Deltaproteobacteria bacterium]